MRHTDHVTITSARCIGWLSHALSGKCEMANERPYLMTLLQSADAIEQDAERLLRQIHMCSVADPPLATRISVCLEETIRHRDSISHCIGRIEGDENSPQVQTQNLPASVETGIEASQESLDASLTELYREANRGIAFYTSVVVAAEAGGFFETRLVCDAILSQKSSMANWLSDLVRQ